MSDRRRHVAADEAHAWARSLRLGNPHGKSVLRALALYVDGEGCCFVGMDLVAADTDLSVDTVRRRIVWLDQIGAVTRIAQWIDENGRRNGEGRGRRTTDKIKLLTNADQDEIEAKAKGQSDPSGGLGQTEGDETEFSPSVALGQPLQCGQGLDSESYLRVSSEPEESPQPPKGGGQAIIDQDLERDLAEAQRVYPGPITNLPRLRSVMGALAPPERQRVLTAMRGYASFIADCERKGKARAVKDADRWVASGMWTGYRASGEQTEVAALVQRVPADSPEGRAWAMLHKIAGLSEPDDFGAGYRLNRPLDARALCFEKVPEEAAWEFVPETATSQVGAWREFLRETLEKPLGLLIRDRVWRGRERITQRGFIAPWPWPPRKDGTLSATGPPSATLMNAEDESVKL